MALYISQHTLACLTRQGAEELTRRLQGAQAVKARRVLVNMQEGKMLVEFEAASREELEKWLATESSISTGSCASNSNRRKAHFALLIGVTRASVRSSRPQRILSIRKLGCSLWACRTHRRPAHLLLYALVICRVG